jgi:hypothetical protein
LFSVYKKLLHILKGVRSLLRIVNVMVKASSVRKGLIVYCALVVLSMMAISPSLGMPERLPFKASFTGYVASVTPLMPMMKNMLRFNIVTSGTVTDCNILKAFLSGQVAVVIKEQITLHLPEGNGFSIGSFTVITTVGEIQVHFIAKVTGVIYFKGVYEITGGTGLFQKVKGYGVISGFAAPTDPSNPLSPGVAVYGTVDGYIWGLPLHIPAQP